jgi:hypothetical protein
MYKQKVSFDIAEPLRVAVLPFYQLENGTVINSDPDIYIIDHIPGVSKKQEDAPSILLQNMVQRELERTAFDISSSGVVTTHLVHHNYRKDRSFDHEQIMNTPPKKLCEILSCDAVLYGKVLDWDRAYYGLQTVNSVKFELKLVRARDNKTLFTATAEDTDSRGISKGPTGYSSLIIEPIKGLDSDIILQLAQRMVSKSLGPLLVENKPEFLETPAPGIYAAAHNSHDGLVSRKDGLVILMIGSADKKASFSIGQQISHVPMIEKYRGHYMGIYFPLDSDNFDGKDVLVSLVDKFGRETTAAIGSRKVQLK